jgi:di/tripeptidase
VSGVLIQTQSDRIAELEGQIAKAEALVRLRTKVAAHLQVRVNELTAQLDDHTDVVDRLLKALKRAEEDREASQRAERFHFKNHERALDTANRLAEKCDRQAEILGEVYEASKRGLVDG